MELRDAVLFLTAAVVVVPIFKRAGLGAVLGYLAAGVAVGPSGFGLIHEVESTLHFAELGVVFLMFLVGLELQPSRLWKLRAQVFQFGGLQVALTGVAIAPVAWLCGLTPAASLVVGVALALSSTAFGLQILTERRELPAPHGQAAFGILLFQDIAASPLLAVLPLLGVARAAESGAGSWQPLLVAVGTLAALPLASRDPAPPAVPRGHGLPRARAVRRARAAHRPRDRRRRRARRPVDGPRRVPRRRPARRLAVPPRARGRHRPVQGPPARPVLRRRRHVRRPVRDRRAPAARRGPGRRHGRAQGRRALRPRPPNLQATPARRPDPRRGPLAGRRVRVRGRHRGRRRRRVRPGRRRHAGHRRHAVDGHDPAAVPPRRPPVQGDPDRTRARSTRSTRRTRC
jgi:hypothetical protein